jgi:PAS domain S-box-containing protein
MNLSSRRHIAPDYYRLFELMPDAAWIHQNDQILLANSGILTLLGAHRPGELLGHSPFEFIHPECHDVLRERFAYLSTANEKLPLIEEKLIRLDGAVMVVEVTGMSLDVGGQPAILSIFRDISMRKQAEEAVHRAEAQLRLVTESAPVMIAYIDRDQHYRYGNKAVEDWFGVDRGSTIGLHIRDIIGEATYAGVAANVEASLNGQKREADERIVISDGSPKHVHVSYVPDFSDGRVQGIVAVLTDITPQKEAQERQNVQVELLERLRTLAEPDDIQWHTVNLIGDYLKVARCCYAEVDPNWDFIKSHRDYCRDAGTLEGEYTLSSLSHVIRERLLRGQTVAVDDVEGSENPGELYGTKLAATSLRSFLCVPVIRNGTLTCLVSLYDRIPRRWSPEEISLVESVAERTALAFDNARLRSREHHIAVTLQSTLLTVPSQESLRGLKICTRYEPALAEADVGGDFIDAFVIHDHVVALVVGDASGKGLAAAIRTAEVKYLLRGNLFEHRNPETALGRVNAVFMRRQEVEGPDSGFVSVVIATVDTLTGETSITSAGGEPPLVVNVDGSVRSIDVRSHPLGVVENPEYATQAVDLGVNDILIMATDGITEARRGTEMFGADGLAQAASMACMRCETLEEVTEYILTAARTHAGAFRDDVGMLLARRYSPDAQAG